jgi:membrane associated rhomboid family serine protease
VDAHGEGYANRDVPTCYRHPDRETGLSCSECGRPICTDCVTFAPVGLRCPDHAGKPARGTPRAVRSVQRPLARRGFVIPSDAIVTRILVAVNIVVYLITVAQGAGLNDPGGSLFNKWALFGPLVDQGDWWRLITSAFLHGSVLHIAFNMLALWWLGAPVEMVLGRVRFLGLYFVSGLAGAAGALVANPTAVTVGASGAIFGLLGAGLILEWQATGSLAGNYLTLIVINLAISFAVPNISVGGHIGGLIGGILITLAFARFGRGRVAHTRLDVLGAASLVLIALASVLIAYLKVRGLT